VAAKPYEVIAKCTMVGLPAASDIVAVGERLEKARRHAHGVVRAVAQPPAVFRDGGYVVEARIVTWADDGDAALRAAEGLFEAAKVVCADLYLSGRTLSEADAPRPVAARTSAPRKPAPAAKPKTSVRGRTAKGGTVKGRTTKRRGRR
jgi:hypothetical protein